ncbi:hypothetical protein GGI1_23446, partial [Acidithiobacillus sp. GGI-221]
MMVLQEHSIDGVSLEIADGFLNGLEARLCRDIETAQHRVVIGQAKENLELVRELQRRLVLDKALLRLVPSQAAASAVGDVMRDFERRVVASVDSVDKLVEQLVARYADDEELEQSTQEYQKQAETVSRGFLAGRRRRPCIGWLQRVPQRDLKTCWKLIRIRGVIDSK